ncbi:TB2/DP1, HVA22 family-domain-containing protein [Armillaria novae-zelandiae]|uniref:Protein YOP1 n=1 Tax=Armillaria novae-zelandiae TaxID=153914 RepID=A0AA39UCZ1_9AGAR|nr:TB2/DP1, HVA22 family-domain-containing protein [Armillaria novae-zelandiae]
MLFYLTSRIICSISAFLYPGYASYKTLSQRPASEEELERWLMYWSVLGCIVSVEYVAEWLISWIPFYYLTKTLFLLYLSLPQTQGSTYLYINHLEPFFTTHEAQIDATTASLRAKLYSFVQARARALWDQISASVGQQAAVAGDGPPPSLANPVSGPAQLVTSFWRSYGPGIVASGAALLKQATPAPAPTPASSRMSGPTTRSLLERRRQLEAELAALPTVGEPGSPLLSPPARVSSEQDVFLRERAASVTGRYEEIEVPGDVEGYDVGPSEGDGVGHSYDSRPAAQKRGSSWFGWGGASGAAEYERVKSD